MVLSLDPCDPDVLSGFLGGVHRCLIKHNIRCKLKQGPKGQANLGGSGGMVPWKILKFVAKDVKV